jgi:hypothetical protein
MKNHALARLYKVPSATAIARRGKLGVIPRRILNYAQHGKRFFGVRQGRNDNHVSCKPPFRRTAVSWCRDRQPATQSGLMTIESDMAGCWS